MGSLEGIADSLYLITASGRSDMNVGVQPNQNFDPNKETDKALALHQQGGPPETEPSPKLSDDAICKNSDPGVFFPEENDTRTIDAAKKICQMCGIQVDCLDWALEKREKFGIWGGLTERERKRVSRQTRNGSSRN